MLRKDRAAAVAACVLLLTATGCSDIRSEVDANREPGPRPSPLMTSAPDLSGLDGERYGERPTPSGAQGPCPDSGVSVSNGPVDGAMGRRAVAIQLRNCGERPYRVNGYPEIGILDKDHEPVEPTLTHGHAYTDTSRDQRPKALTLAPGESATSVLNWRSRGGPETAPGVGSYVVVASAPGKERTTLPLWIDLIAGDDLDVTAWAAEPAAPAS